MKLSITQMVLGILVIFAACYVTGWMIHEAPNQLEQPIPNFPVDVTKIDVIQEHEALFNVSRYGSLALPILGILVLIISIVQSTRVNTRTRKLITVNITAGALIAMLAIVIFGYGYPTFSYSATVAGSDELIRIYIFTEDNYTSIGLAIGIVFLVGLSIFGVGIAQLVKSKKTQNI